jgi:hypothetical protein
MQTILESSSSETESPSQETEIQELAPNYYVQLENYA